MLNRSRPRLSVKPLGKAASSSALQGRDFSTNAADAQRARLVLWKPQSSSVSITCFITVLPVRAVHALEAAGGLSLNDALPRAREAVPAAVRERHLQDKSPTRVNGGSAPHSVFLQQNLGLPPRFYCLSIMLDGEPQRLTSSQNRYILHSSPPPPHCSDYLFERTEQGMVGKISRSLQPLLCCEHCELVCEP